MSEKRDTSVIKVDATESPAGPHGLRYLASGKSLAMRLWVSEEPGEKAGEATRRDYETVGFVVDGRAELHIEGQVVTLEPGNSWVVPKGAEHAYRILEPFTAVEATHPPFHVHGRDL
jgi:mannose-6-phosphate isomerase-like protein (cupin superfamily)